MKKYLITFLFLFNIAYADVSAKLDRNPVATGETVNLIITTTTAKLNDVDLAVLRTDFDVLANGTSSEISIISGNRTQRTQLVITLMPKRSGMLTIPALRVGNEMTQALQLTVRAPARMSGNRLPIFIEANLNSNEAYVGSQIDYVVKLFFQGGGLTGQLIPPQLDNIMFKAMGEVRQYQVQRDNEIYGVAEWHYSFSPQQAGSLKIPGAVFNGSIPLTVPGVTGNVIVGSGRTINLTAPAVMLSVKALPTTAAFAAKQVSLQSKWSSSPPIWQVGQPVTRVITLQVTGVAAEKLPSINTANVTTANIYPDQPRLQTEMRGADIVGTREEKIAYIPQQAGSLTLPAIAINWFNTSTGKMEVASLPAETVKVSNVGANVVAPASTDPTHTKTESSSTSSGFNYWLWLVVVVLILWGLTLLLWWRSSRRKHKVHSSPTSLTPSQLRTAIRDACNQNDAKQLQQAVLKWAQLIWPDLNIQNLGEVMAQDIAPRWRTELQKLSEVIYKNTDNKCDGHRCWLAFVEQEHYKPAAAEKDLSDLPPLYK